MTKQQNRPHGYALVVNGETKLVTDMRSDARHFAQFYSEGEYEDVQIQELMSLHEYITRRLELAAAGGSERVERVIVAEAKRIENRRRIQQAAQIR